jgi:hypothetical protein
MSPRHVILILSSSSACLSAYSFYSVYIVLILNNYVNLDLCHHYFPVCHRQAAMRFKEQERSTH